MLLLLLVVVRRGRTSEQGTTIKHFFVEIFICVYSFLRSQRIYSIVPERQIHEVDDVESKGASEEELEVLVVRGVELVAEGGVPQLVRLLQNGHRDG